MKSRFPLRWWQAAWLVMLCLTAAGIAAQGPGVPNVAYPPARVGEILSSINPEKAVSATELHRGYLFMPLSHDGGGGTGKGAFAFYDVSDPASPSSVFDSRSEPARYHTAGTLDYVGDWAEVHHLPVSGDLMLISELRGNSAGFSIFDAAPLYDEDPATQPCIVSRYSYPGVTGTTNYDGYSFAPGWQGRRYVYAPTGAQGLYVIDTSDLDNPVQLRHMSRAQLDNVTMRAAWPIGNLLILSEANIQGDFQARIYDIGDPGNPVRIGAFSGPFGYHGFVYGSAFYGGGTPIVRHDFSDPGNVVQTNLYQDPGFIFPEYGFGKDGNIFIGQYPGATKWVLNGNTASNGGRIDTGQFDDHAFLNPLGNLLVLCSDHNIDRRLLIGIHTTEQDLSPPQPLFCSPANGATNQNVLSRVGISFSDFVDPVSANSATISVRRFGDGAVVPGSYSSMRGIVNFAPDSPLDANTTYDVILTAGGVRDQAGNAVPQELRVTRFSTGSALNDYRTAVAATTPRETGAAANFSVTVTNSGGLSLEHSWDFGDGSPATAFSTSTTASHTYSSAGNHIVRVSTRIAGQTYAPSVSGVQVVHRPIPATKPLNQTTIVVDPARSLVWNVNKDNNSVTAIGANNYQRFREVAVGTQPSSLAIGPGDTLWVVNKGSSNISVLARATGALAATHPLPPGSSPHGIVIDIAAGVAYVSLEASGRIAKLDTATGAVLATLEVGPWPRGLALDPGRQKLWVSRFISPDAGGRVIPVDLATFTPGAAVPLAAVMEPDSLQNGRGIPNYLGALALSPDLTHGFVPAKKDNIFRGLQRDGLPLTFEHSVRSMAVNLDLATGQENPAMRLDFDNSDFATAAVFSPLGNVVFFATSGSATIWVADAYDPSSRYSLSSEGQAPDGMVLSADGTRLYVHNFMDRSITVFQSGAACGAICGTAPRLAKTTTVSSEPLSPLVLRGKQLFYGTKDPRLAQEGYMSCASCHLDGGHDGRTWDFSNFGEGLRNTIGLNGHGIGHGPLHWTANFDEVQDFEGQIRDFSQGSGLMNSRTFHIGSHSQPLGEAKAGLSADLDALAAYVASLGTAGRSPQRLGDGNLSPAATLGREVFRQRNCAACHGGTAFSDSAALTRHDVGTLSAASGARLGGEIDGLDTPTLRGLWNSAPYLHDGSAATLRDVLVSRNPAGRHGDLSGISSVEIDQLAAYLGSIDDLELTAPTTSTGTAPVLASPGEQVHPIGQALSLQFSALGSGLAWQAFCLPPGLSIDGSGLVAGIPTTPGNYPAQVAVRDAAGRFSTISFMWTIRDPAARRYVKLVSLSSITGAPYTSLADFNLLDADGRPYDRSGWIATASEEVQPNKTAGHAIDASTETIWQTYLSGSPFPHHLVVDMGGPAVVTGFTCLPRQDGLDNGRMKGYELYWSEDGINWGSPVATGIFPNSLSRQLVWLDTDGDGFGNRLELALGTDPASAASMPPSCHSGLRGWWRLDEAGGSIAADGAGQGDGVTIDAPLRTSGISGGALYLNGTSQAVELPSPGLTSNSVTLGAWIRRDGAQTDWAGIAFSRSTSACGFGFGPSNQLRYHWNDAQSDFATGLTAPDHVWTFCALVVEPARATLYMKPLGGAMQSVVNNVAHQPGIFNGAWYLGRDPVGNRHLKGQIDDARLYGRALSAAEISALADSAGPVPPPAGHYDWWLLDNGLPADGSGPGSPGVDPSGDGVPNEMKFALGLPVDSAGYDGRFTAGMIEINGETYNTLTYTRPEPPLPGASYAVKVSSALSAWSAAPVVEVSSSVANGLRTITVRDTVPASKGAPRRFIRLEVSR